MNLAIHPAPIANHVRPKPSERTGSVERAVFDEASPGPDVLCTSAACICGATIAQGTDPVGQRPCAEPSAGSGRSWDSYGYRPGRSAHQAIAVARKRCWRFDWVLDLDIKGFFDNIDHALLMRAVRRHTKSRWMLLYIERWLKAPVRMADGTLVQRDKGTPQGGVVTPRTHKVISGDRYFAAAVGAQ